MPDDRNKPAYDPDLSLLKPVTMWAPDDRRIEPLHEEIQHLRRQLTRLRSLVQSAQAVGNPHIAASIVAAILAECGE